VGFEYLVFEGVLRVLWVLVNLGARP